MSTGLAERGELTAGDPFTIEYDEQPIETYVAGTVRYWQSLNPHDRQFLILNLDHVQELLALEPYDSWYRLSAGADTARIMDDLEDLGVWPGEMHDTEQILAGLYREPYRRGFFGVLTIGFMAALLVAVLAFVVYTTYGTVQRLTQFGALRANGLSLGQTFGVVSLEQLLTVGVGLLIGLAAGAGSTQLFLPFLRDRAADLQPVPPFTIVTETGDVTRIVVVIGGALVVGVVVVALLLVRAKLAAALRLGEDR